MPTPDEALAEQVAEIIGPNSAAALALAELKRRRDEGQPAWIAIAGNRWVVGADAIVARSAKTGEKT